MIQIMMFLIRPSVPVPADRLHCIRRILGLLSPELQEH